MRAQTHLEQDGTYTTDNKSGDRVGVHRAWGGKGLSACPGDILLESLVACAGVTLGQIAKAIEADSDIMLPVKYWRSSRTGYMQRAGLRHRPAFYQARIRCIAAPRG